MTKKALNIREVPPALMRRLKAEAGNRGITMREFVLGVLAKEVGGGIPIPPTSKQPDAESTVAAVKQVEEIPPEDVDDDVESNHDPKSCHFYGCLLCKEMGVKDAKRGV